VVLISSRIQNLRDWDRVIQISILICQEPRRRMLPHAWLFYFDPYWGWWTPVWTKLRVPWTKLWVPRSGKDLAKQGAVPYGNFQWTFQFSTSSIPKMSLFLTATLWGRS